MREHNVRRKKPYTRVWYGTGTHWALELATLVSGCLCKLHIKSCLRTDWPLTSLPCLQVPTFIRPSTTIVALFVNSNVTVMPRFTSKFTALALAAAMLPVAWSAPAGTLCACMSPSLS